MGEAWYVRFVVLGLYRGDLFDDVYSDSDHGKYLCAKVRSCDIQEGYEKVCVLRKTHRLPLGSEAAVIHVNQWVLWMMQELQDNKSCGLWDFCQGRAGGVRVGASFQYGH